MSIEDPTIALAFDIECAETLEIFRMEQEVEKINAERRFLAKLITGEDLD